MSCRLMFPLPFFALLLPQLVVAEEDPALRHFRDLAETRNYTLGRPVAPRFSPDGGKVFFLRAEPREPSLRLYELELESGRERELLTPESVLAGEAESLSAEEKARRERQRQSLRGFTSFHLSQDGARALVMLSGRAYVLEIATGEVRPLPGEDWIDPRFSPDGRRVAAVRARELHVIDLDTLAAAPATRGADAFISHGTAEFIAQEEMKRDEGFWWAPDSERLLFQQTDERDVEVRYIADPLHPERAPGRFFYPKAGSENARVRLGVTSRRGGEPVWLRWDADRYPYVARVDWSRPNAPLTVLVQNRRQTEQLLLAFDPATGAPTELLREGDPAWLNLDYEVDLPVWLEDGKRFLWSSERLGAWQLELREATGAFVRALTPPDFIYRGLVGVHAPSGTVLVRGGNVTPEIHLWRFPLEGGAGAPLTREPGHHGAVLSAAHGRFVHLADRFDGRYEAAVRALDGRHLAALAVAAEALPQRPTTELRRTSGTPSFDAAITRPRTFTPGRKYPVILQVYAGPGVKRVNAVVRDYLPDQWMADQGYIVVRIDGRGTPGRGRDWERVIKHNFIDVPLADQIAGLEALASDCPEMDLERVGATGWSWGGYFTAMAALRRPDLFKASVVGAPVITWENYDTHYTERYLGLPQEQPEAYRISNVTSYVGGARRPLLLIHGLTDDNVYFQHTLQLADALFLAGHPYEMIPMLGTHMVSDPKVRLRQQQRVMAFFATHLQPTVP